MALSGIRTRVRAELTSSSEFALVVEGARPLDLLQDIAAGMERMGAESRTIHQQLVESGRCELEGVVYPRVEELLQNLSSAGTGKQLHFAPLPSWLVAALPSFGGVDGSLSEPPALWLPDRLMPYQIAGVRRGVVQGGRVLLADEMGLGKTAQALAVMAQYLEDEGPALVVAPSSLVGMWKEQALAWLPQLRPSEVQVVRGVQDRPLPQARIVIISYSIVVRGGCTWASRGQKWRIVTCDEAHYLRNPESQRGKLLVPLLQAALRCILITGTPTPKQASEAFSLLHALRPLKCSFQEWCERYGTQSTEHGEAEVAALLSEVMVRRKKADVLDQLPPKHRHRISLHLPSAKAALLKKLQSERLGGSTDEQHFQQLASVKEAATQDYAEYLLDASGGKFLLFAHHRSMLDALEETIRKRGAGFVRIDGSTAVKSRQGLVRRFQEDPSCRVALLAVLAAGEGLTFTAASVCVFCELCPAVPGVIEQAEGRVHRIGQAASGVDVHFLVVAGTRDDQVFERLEARTGSVARAVGDVPELDESQNDPVAELEGLFKQANAPKAKPARRRASTAAEAGTTKRKRKLTFDLESVLGAGISKLQAELSLADPPEVLPEAPVDALAPSVVEADGAESSRPPRKRLAPLFKSPVQAAAGVAEASHRAEVTIEAPQLQAAPLAESLQGALPGFEVDTTKPATLQQEGAVAKPTPVHEVEDAVDMALSFFASEVRAAPLGREATGRSTGRAGSHEVAEEGTSGTETRLPCSLAAESESLGASCKAKGKDDLSSLLDSLIDSARASQ